MKVFIGPTEISGIGVGLARGLRALGIEADVRCRTPHPFAYGKQERDAHAIVRLWQRLGFYRQSGSRVIRLLARVLQQVMSFWVLLVLARRYDAFIFLFGDTVTGSYLDAWMLRRLGKRTIVVFCGSDARPPYVEGGRAFSEGEGFLPAFRLWREVRRRAHRVHVLERFAHVVVNSPSTGQFHRQKFVNWFCMGIPRGSQALQAREVSERPEPESLCRDFHVLHCPSNRKIKGSDLISLAIDELKAEGVPITLTELHGVSNAQVCQAMRACHLVCDQLYSDTPMAALASEAAESARPVLVGGYFSDHAELQIPAQLLPPSYFIRPDQLKESLRFLAGNPDVCSDLGVRAQRFVSEQWNEVAVSQRYLSLIVGQVPDEWWLEPEDIDYTGGCGLSLEQAGRQVKKLTRYFGIGALGLQNGSELQRRFLALRNMAEPEKC